MTLYGETRKSLREEKLAPQKQLGQNFLVHKATAAAVAGCGKIHPNDIIIEVGVGLGALTLPIAEQAAQVVGLEVDSGIVRLHEKKNDLPDNVTLLHQDILKADFDELYRLSKGPLKIMANLPYSISNPFLFKLIEHQEKVAWATVMLQKEVADRLTATPSTKQYGIPTVLLKSCATVKPLLTLKPAEFHPRPKIDSVVVRIEFYDPEKVAGRAYDRFLFQKIVRAAFSQRRKTLLNTLTAGGFFRTLSADDKKLAKQLTCETITQAEIKPGARAETLDLEQFIDLTMAFSLKLSNG
ncbi:ribosomal RNA small subunit methyltransferase A [Desulfocapsa sp. AH-315-G09]|uniref:Ribosomal RNA small subunit methyltransferase A n=1 Tax=Desulfotalea psychrophila TaxID=84980 RepID=A0ABS3ATM8_9BACT|nr:ribosomal RNA small subunit methyltransferase A [bacterium AH-315-I07]MBN4065023.1 ribosomal RNA small subunit methyltransferase A [Desulfocapsa sp. AH-315-G09]MBN4068108.1 ribosomal RNA small subunit methyltransferase A [Desulfotalea psychrophila]